MSKRLMSPISVSLPSFSHQAQMTFIPTCLSKVDAEWTQLKITQNRRVSSLLGDSFRSRCRQATAPTTCVQQDGWIHRTKLKEAKDIQRWTSLNIVVVNLTRPTPRRQD